MKEGEGATPSPDEWRGDLCAFLRGFGVDRIADEAGAFSDEQIEDMRRDEPSPRLAALSLIHADNDKRKR